MGGTAGLGHLSVSVEHCSPRLRELESMPALLPGPVWTQDVEE